MVSGYQLLMAPDSMHTLLGDPIILFESYWFTCSLHFILSTYETLKTVTMILSQLKKSGFFVDVFGADSIMQLSVNLVPLVFEWMTNIKHIHLINIFS